MRPLVHALWILAWAVVLVSAGLVVVEESGVLAGALRRAAGWRLGPLGEGLEVGRVRLRWFEPGVELEDVSIRSPGAAGSPGTELVYLRKVHFSLDLNLQQRPLRHLHVDGGRIRVSDALRDGLNRVAARWESASTGTRVEPPPFLVTNFEVELEMPDGTFLELGTANLFARPAEDGDGGFEFSGELLPSLSGAVAGTEPIRFGGRQSASGVELRATSADIELHTRGLAAPESSAVPFEEFAGRLSLDATGRLDFGDRVVATGSVRARLSEARLLPRPGDPWIEDLHVDVETQFHPGAEGDLWGRDSWDALSHIRARWNGSPVEAWGVLGKRAPPGAWLRCFGRAERLPLAESTLRGLGAMEAARETWEAFSPAGAADASVELVVTREPVPDGTVRFGRRIAAHVRHVGESGATFHGYRSSAPGNPRMGVPLPCTHLRGHSIFVFDDERSPRDRLVLVDLSAATSNGPVSGWGSIQHLGELEGLELDLEFELPGAVIDERLRRVLGRSAMTRDIPVQYDPMGGTVATRWRLQQSEATGGSVSGVGEIHVEDTQARWQGLPVPLRGASGELKILWAARPTRVWGEPRTVRPFGVFYDFRNDSSDHVGVTARVRGFFREESLPALIAPSEIPPVDRGGINGLDITIEEVLLRGKDWDVLADAFPQLKEQRARLNAVGGVHLSFEGSQPHPDLPWTTDVEVTPRVVEVTPEFFPRRTKDIDGRILVRTVTEGESTDVETRLVLAGHWPQGVELAAMLDVPAEGVADALILGAGVDPGNRAFKGALIDVLSTEGSEGGIDPSELELAGFIDVEVRTRFEVSGREPPDDVYRVFLRNATLETDSLRLENVDGVLKKSGDILRSPLLLAELAGHRVQLTDVLVFPLDRTDDVAGLDPLLLRSGFVHNFSGTAVQARLYTTNFPLDDVHVSRLALTDAPPPANGDPDWEGRLDVIGARVLVTNPEDGAGKLVLHGNVRPHDVSLRFGFPIEIDTADVRLRELVFERGGVRAWGEIASLDARIAERELSDASMILGFVDQRLTIDDLDGRFEGGRLRSLGSTGPGTRKALGVDLKAPHRFDVAVQLENVQVDRFLRGMFQSSVADAGQLTASLQLAGTPKEVLEWTGRGSLDLDEGRLWSIPAARVVFSAFGFPNTAVFDRLRARFELRDGIIRTHHVQLKSTLLNLIGSGWHDLDGRLGYELDVRSGLIDRLGVFNRLLYWLNRNLWRVTIDGDFNRPEVRIRSSLLELFRGEPEARPRQLPLPGFAPLGPRF